MDKDKIDHHITGVYDGEIPHEVEDPTPTPTQIACVLVFIVWVVTFAVLVVS
jgi:hypothetical protein